MKRIFLILCLITICDISYADIASVGYVDSVVATKQDTISDIETIRTGAAAGAKAVQPSSLSTVATSGSYNDLSNKPTNISSFTNDSGYITNSYHDSTKQDKLPTGPSDGKKYSLVWNGKTGQFVFVEMPPLQCSSGTYDIGFSQCIDPATNGTDYGCYSHDGQNKNNDTTYNLSAGEWATEFSYGIVKGNALCSSTNGTYGVAGEPDETPGRGGRCWCKMTSPAASRWVFYYDTDNASLCAYRCAPNCATLVETGSDFRSGVFSSVGQ